MAYYRLYGLNVESELKCAAREVPQPESVDLSIRFGEVPETLGERAVHGFKFEARDGVILFKTDMVGNFLVTGGNEIVIRKKEEATLSEVHLLVFGWCFGALLIQRSTFPLHGCALEKNGRTVIFCGPSGSGKSTISAGLLERGFRLFDDNVAVLRSDGDRILVEGGCSQLKLVGVETGRFEVQGQPWGDRLMRGRDKFVFGVDAQFSEAPGTLSAIYIIKRTEDETFGVRILSGLEKLQALSRNVFCRRFVPVLGREKELFYSLQKIAEVATVYEVSSTQDPAFPCVLIDRLRDHLGLEQ